MNSDDKIVEILEDLQADVKGLNNKVDKQGKQIDTLVDTAGHTNTALKAVATKHDVEVAVDSAKNELKADILMLDSKVAKKIQSHERRITNFEDQTGIENPEKH